MNGIANNLQIIYIVVAHHVEDGLAHTGRDEWKKGRHLREVGGWKGRQ